jgi:anti-anti-sigma regulatory factor
METKGHRMLRIVALGRPGDGATLSLEGRVIGPWVDELRQSCQRVLATGATLTVDLAEVTFVERNGVRLLKDLLDSGVAVANCPAFVTEQLKALSPC